MGNPHKRWLVCECVCVCLWACLWVQLLAGNGHELDSLSEVQRGRGWRRSGRWTERWRGGSRDRLLFCDGCTHPPVSPGLFQQRVREMAPPRGGKTHWFYTSNQVISVVPESCSPWPSYLLSRNVSVSAGGGSSLWLAIGRDIEEVPDQNGVVVRTAYDLELIKLEAEHTARVLLKRKEEREKKRSYNNRAQKQGF